MDKGAGTGLAVSSAAEGHTMMVPGGFSDRAVGFVHRNRSSLSNAVHLALAAVAAVLALGDVMIWLTDPVVDTGRLSFSVASLVPLLGIMAVAAIQVRQRRLSPVVAISTLSIALTATSLVIGSSLPPSLAVVFTLGVLITRVVRSEPMRRATAPMSMALIAMLAETIRPQVAPAGYLFVLVATGAVAAVGVGIYFRWSDWRLLAEARSARNEERLAIAGELHDIVGHHLMGIVVQARAAHHIAESDPSAAIATLERIGDEGAEALSVMRWLVSTFREEGERVIEWRDIARLVGGVSAPGVEVALAMSPDLEQLDVGHAAPAYRIVAESVTNALKHGLDVSLIEVSVASDGGHLIVTVKDDGIAPRVPGTGSGITGMRRLVESLGGLFAAGPVVPHGWRVRAEMPPGPQER